MIHYVFSIVNLSIMYQEELPTVFCKTMKGTCKMFVFSGKFHPRTGHEVHELE